jgi:hypothetical protein
MYGSATPRVVSEHPGPQPSPEISHYGCAGVNCTQKKAWRPLDGDLESSDLRRGSGSLFRVVCAEKQATQVCPTLLNKSSVRSTSRKRASTKSRCTLTEEHLHRTANHGEEWFGDLSQRPLNEQQRLVVRGRSGATIAINTNTSNQSTFNQR